MFQPRGGSCMLESSESSHTNVLTKKTKLSCRNGAAAVGVVLGEPAESCLGPGKFGRKFPLHTPPPPSAHLAWQTSSDAP